MAGTGAQTSGSSPSGSSGRAEDSATTDGNWDPLGVKGQVGARTTELTLTDGLATPSGVPFDETPPQQDGFAQSVSSPSGLLPPTRAPEPGMDGGVSTDADAVPSSGDAPPDGFKDPWAGK